MALPVGGQQASRHGVDGTVGILDGDGGHGRAQAPSRTGSQAGGDPQPGRTAGQRHARGLPSRSDQPPQPGCWQRRQVRAQQHGGRGLPCVQADDLLAGAGHPGRHRHSRDHSRCPGDRARTGQRQRRQRVHPDVRTGGERGLVLHRAVPALVLRDRQRSGADREDNQQHRAALPDRPPADLPAGQCRAKPPGPPDQAVDGAGECGQQAERHEREPGQRQRWRQHRDRIDAQAAGPGMRDRGI